MCSTLMRVGSGCITKSFLQTLPQTTLQNTWMRSRRNISSQFTEATIGKLKVLSKGNGNCICEFHVKDSHLNHNGTLHGGCTVILADIVSAKALFSKVEPKGVSINLNVTFLASAKEGDDIIVEAKTVKSENHLGIIDVKLYKKVDNTIVATGTHTIYLK